MHYTRNLRKKEIAKRVIFLLAVVAVVSFILGGCAGYILKTYVSVSSEFKTEDISEPCKKAM